MLLFIIIVFVEMKKAKLNLSVTSHKTHEANNNMNKCKYSKHTRFYVIFHSDRKNGANLHNEW